MKVEYIICLSRSGSTKYGEYLTEKLNSKNENSLFVGESIHAFWPSYYRNNLKHKYCSCGKKYEKCIFWKDLSYKRTLKDYYNWIIEKTKLFGYSTIIDSSKKLKILNLYNEMDIDLRVHFIIRSPFSWAKSSNKHSKLQGESPNNILWQIFFNWLPRNFYYWYKLRKYNPNILCMKYWNVKGKFNEHKHIYIGSDNKFNDEFKNKFKVDKRGYYK